MPRLARSVLVCVAAAAAVPAQSTSEFVYRGSSSGESISSAGSATWTATSIEASMQARSGSGGASGLVLSYQDSNDYYLFLHSFSSAAWMIYRRAGGAWTLLAKTPAPTVFGETHVMRAEQNGSTLALYWDDVLEVTATDGTFDHGQVGLRVWNQTVDFDDVLVRDGSTTLLADDFEDGDDDGWSGGSAWNVVAVGGSGVPMPAPTFDSSFENGNGQLDWVDPQAWTLHVTPELKGSSPYRSWFSFQLGNLSSAQPTHIQLGTSSWLQQPVYSYDRVTWQPLPAEPGGYAVTFTGDPVWIAHSIPYTAADEQRLLADVAGPSVRETVLATSEGGRPVHLLTITDPSATGPRYGIWMVARQHAWEASGSWIADGLVRFLVSGGRHAQSLLQKAIVHVVPIMDQDNVALGGSGKDQQPIDINRDWRSQPHWNAVQAAIAAIDAFAAGNDYDVFLDSHCPGSPTMLAVQPQSMLSAERWSDFLRFRRLLQSTAGPGAGWTGSYVEWGPSYAPLWYQMSFWHQHTTHPEVRLSLTVETGAADAQTYQTWSKALGEALDLYLYDRFGTATPTTAGTPSIDFAGTPVLGASTTALIGSGLLPHSRGVAALGSRWSPPFALAPLGGVPGSFVLVQPALTLPFTATASGRITLPMPVPSSPSLAGARLSFQLFDLDPSLGVPLPLGHSAGLSVELVR